MAARQVHARPWVERFRAEGLRLTCCRRAVLAVLERCKVPLTVDQLARNVNRLAKTHRHDLSTLYRNVEILQAAGIVRRVDFGDGTARYELDEGHNHYVHCVKCGRVAAIGRCDLGDLSRQVERQLGYVVTGHHLHLTGLCRRCRR